MSNDMVRELFRNLENTLHERLRIIEDILSNQRSSGNASLVGVEQQLHDMGTTVRLVEENTMKEIHAMTRKFDTWMQGMNKLEQDMNTLRVELRSRKPDERPVEAVQAELEQDLTQAAALDADVDATVVEVNAKQALKKAVQALPSPIHKVVEEEVVEEEEEEVVEEEEEEEEVEEEEVVEEEEEEVVEEEEEEEEALTEFTYKGKTYYHDADYKVYVPDEDGAVGDPVGIYDPQAKRIRRLT
jgi:DNA polymerase III gamma/tau subunit